MIVVSKFKSLSVLICSIAISVASVTPTYALPTVIVSGSLTYQGQAIQRTTYSEIGWRDGCSVGGLMAYPKGQIDSSGNFSFEAPAGCVGQFSFYVTATVPSMTDTFFFTGGSNSYTSPASNVELSLDIPKLVRVQIETLDTNGIPLTNSEVGIVTDSGYPDAKTLWPQVEIFNTDIGTVIGGFGITKYGCTTGDDGICTFYVPQNSITEFSAAHTTRWFSTNPVRKTVSTTSTETIETTFTFSRLPDPETVIVSGSLTYQGQAIQRTTYSEIGWRDGCSVGGLMAYPKGQIDSSGNFSFEAPAGCVGQFSFYVTATVPSMTDTFFFTGGSNSYTSPASNVELSLDIPKLVRVQIETLDTNGIPLTNSEVGIVTDSGYPDAKTLWPQVEIFNTDIGTVIGGFGITKYGCTTGDDGICTFYVPQNSITEFSAAHTTRWFSTNPVRKTVSTTSTETIETTFTFANLAALGTEGASRGLISIVAPDGAVVSSTNVTSTEGIGLPDGSLDLSGTIAYTVSNLALGASIDMKFLLPDEAAPTNIYKSINGVYVDVTSVATIDGRFVILTLKDGGLGDVDGLVNGVIVDPVVMVQNSLRNQSTFSINSVGNTTVTSSVSLSTTGGSGTGLVKYLARNGTATGCVVNGNVLTASTPGTCIVVASRYGDSQYRLVSSAERTITFVPSAPTVNGFSPSGGGAGTAVTLTGSSFSIVTKVMLNSLSLRFITISDTSMVVVIPTKARSGVFKLTYSGGVVSSQNFTVSSAAMKPTITSLSSTSVITGNTLSVTGAHLGAATSVKIGSITIPFQVMAANQIVLTIPSSAVDGKIIVTTPGGSVTSSQTITIQGPPVITKLSATRGRPGASITVTGARLTSASVTLNGVTCTKSSNTATSIKFTVPSLPKGTYTLTVTTALGSTTTSFTVT